MSQVDTGGNNPYTPASPATRPATTGANDKPTQIPSGISKLEDWQAALAAYVVLLYMAEVDSLKELAVALSVAVAVVVSLKDNPLKKVQ